MSTPLSRNTTALTHQLTRREKREREAQERAAKAAAVEEPKAKMPRTEQSSSHQTMQLIKTMSATEVEHVKTIIKKAADSPVCLEVKRQELEAMSAFLNTMLPGDPRVAFIHPMLQNITEIKLDGQHLYQGLTNGEAASLKALIALEIGSGAYNKAKSWLGFETQSEQMQFVSCLEGIAENIPMPEDARKVVQDGLKTLRNMGDEKVSLLIEQVSKFKFGVWSGFMCPGPAVKTPQLFTNLTALLKDVHITQQNDSEHFSANLVSGPFRDGIFLLKGVIDIKNADTSLSDLVNGETIELVMLRHNGRACAIMMVDRTTPPSEENKAKYKEQTGKEWAPSSDICILAELSTKDASTIYQTLTENKVLKDNKVETFQLISK